MRNDEKQSKVVKKEARPTGDTSRRGFASMDKERVREIAREGGRASHGGRGANHFKVVDEEIDRDEFESESYSRSVG